jgi:multidrug efflux system membrane fusion protein
MIALRFLPVTATALLLCGCGDEKDAAASGKGGGMPPAPVTIGAVMQKDMPLDIRTFGNVEPIASVAIKSQVGGELIGVHFTEGEDVEAKKLLFTIQPRLYDTQLAQARANLERDRALAANAALNLKRQEELDAKGAGVKEELERARAEAASTAATVKADEALVLIAETQVGYTTIESPIAGRTGAIRVREGNLIRVGEEEPLTTVNQMSPIYVSFALPEQHLDAIRAGMKEGAPPLSVTARHPGEGHVLGEGRLTFIANAVDTSTGTIGLKATFDNADRALWPGAFVDVSLRLATDAGVLVVPASAVTMGQHGPRIYIVKEDHSTELRPVTVIRTAGNETVLKDGVRAGERVITGGQSRVLPGGKVVPVEGNEKPDSAGKNPSTPAGP